MCCCRYDPLGEYKAKIGKMLELGLHPNTPEHEAQHCMRVAQKLMKK